MLNLVKLTGKEHFVCHMLLTKMVDDPALKLKLSCAAIRMSFSNGVDRYKLTATDYQLVKIQLSKNKKGSKGQTWSDEQRAKLKNRVPHNKGVPMTEESKQNLRDKRKLQVTSPVSEETKQKIRSAFLGKPRPDHIKEKFVPNLRSHKGTKWWNNGVKNKRSDTQPGPEWMLGKITPIGVIYYFIDSKLRLSRSSFGASATACSQSSTALAFQPRFHAAILPKSANCGPHDSARSR